MTARRIQFSRVSLLDEDADLGDGLSERELHWARRHLVTEAAFLPRGVHDPAAVGGSELLALLVVEGILLRRLNLGGRRCGEIVGPGSLLRPWEEREVPVPTEVDWRVVEPARVALLDQHTTAVAARCPALIRTLIQRAIARSRGLAFTVGIVALQHVSLRLVLLFWDLAERFGRVTPDGIVIPIKLSHRDLAELVGAQRPSVSSRLAMLSERGEIRRRPDGTWLLRGEPPAMVQDLRRAGRPTIDELKVDALP